MNRLRETAGQGVGPRTGDLHPHHAPEEPLLPVEVDDAEVGRPARHPPVAVHGVHEDVLDHTQAAGIGLALPALVSAQVLPEVPEGAQAISLLTGEPLFVPEPGEAVMERLEIARSDYEEDPGNADNIIWYGRRTAYAGNYRGAIEIFSEGIEKHPDDARMYRHRGHRYISIREFDRAIEDLGDWRRISPVTAAITVRNCQGRRSCTRSSYCGARWNSPKP